MNNELDKLETIRQVEVSEELYDRILSKIKDRVHNKVSVRQLKMMAAGLALLVLVDGFVLFKKAKKEKTSQVENLIQVQNNMFYNE